MNCEDCRAKLALFLAGELEFDGEEAMESHLEACGECRAEERRLVAVYRALEDSRLEPSLELLSACRQDLTAALSARTATVPWWRRISVAPSLWPTHWQWASGLALVIGGFLGGSVWSTGPSSEPAKLAPIASRVSRVEPDGSGGVRIVVNDTIERVLTGRLDEQSIDSLLKQATRNTQDPTVQVDSMEILKAKCARRDVRDTLLQALEKDPSDGVRLKALEALRASAEEPEVRSALLRVLLRDKNAAVRTQAVELLTSGELRNSDLAGVLQEMMQREDNSYIRQRGQNALRAMNASLEVF